MNLIELHVLQSFPVTCLNRDDLGAPKSAMFGGVQRARVSSQCQKRATREFFHDLDKGFSETARTKCLINIFVRAIRQVDPSKSEEEADVIAKSIIAISRGKKNLFGKFDGNKGLVDTLVFISEECAKNISKHVLDGLRENPKFKPSFNDVSKILAGQVSDAADIALFGRMVAADATNTIEGAALFSHAISTHTVRSELDFFSAVDDEKKNAEDMGAGQIGTIEYNSACYYRYVGLNLDLLTDPNKNNRKFFNPAQLKSILENFIRAAILAVPSARKNSMAGPTRPSYVLAVKRSGQPLSLANAFETPVRSKNGLVEPSVAALENEWKALEGTFGIKTDVLCKLDPKNFGKDERILGGSLDSLLAKILADIA